MKEKKIVEAELVEDYSDAEKSYFFPRFIAYILDVLIVGIVATLILSVIPSNDKYDKYMKEYETIQTNYLEKKIETNEYFEKSKDLVYELDKMAVPSTLIKVVLYIGYFIVFQAYNKGQTLGKKLMKIKIINTKKDELTGTYNVSINQMAIRSIIINSIGINLLMIGSILFINKDAYYYASVSIQGLSFLIIVLSLLMIFIRKDGKGLHDVAANTMVVACK